MLTESCSPFNSCSLRSMISSYHLSIFSRYHTDYPNFRCFFREVLLDLKNGDLRYYYISLNSYRIQIKDLCWCLIFEKRILKWDDLSVTQIQWILLNNTSLKKHTEKLRSVRYRQWCINKKHFSSKSSKNHPFLIRMIFWTKSPPYPQRLRENRQSIKIFFTILLLTHDDQVFYLNFWLYTFHELYLIISR